MLLKILPESFITTGIDISDSHNCLICPSILSKHKETILENPEGCIFKIDFTHEILGTHVTEYVSCLEFTAPKGTIILSNKLFDRLLIDFQEEYYLDIDIFIPPQATKVIFKIENRDIFNKVDIKGFLEKGIDRKYKFLQLNQSLILESIELRVKELEPYHICLINNTDLEVEFYMPPEPDAIPQPVIKDAAAINSEEETVVNQSDSTILHADPGLKKLTREELREVRLKFYRRS